ncbi:Histone-lysine N-methyltransferase ASHH2 [Porphyridium purpureum]|uniref:Histone-lysine N-methyltransferase ASHH2 n=1 Tax=Porphyridium purpureum TaxID=35688 RepID=A0A5J4ZAF7_PORPP|nr:Histone-lysine N-methyltransferase ASHH2 [Porphyridium purpureum]|eukprot:POR7755..scf295_1
MDEIEMPSFERVLQELEAGSTFEEPETNDEFVAFFVAFVRLFSLLSAKDDFVTLKFLLKAKFSSKQKFEHLFVYLFVLHRVIVPDKLAQKELGQFCLAFRFCNQYYTLHFMADARGQDRRRHKLIVEADEVMASGGVGGRGDGHHGGGGAEEDGDGEEQGTAEDASLKDVLSRWHVDLAGRKVDYTGAMRCLASEYDSRLVRLTGEGDIPAEYVKLKRNVYVGDAKKFDKDDSKTQHVCECVHVPGHPSCDDEMCANVSTKVECVPESCPARDSCKNQRFQTQAYAKFSRRKVPEGHKGFAMYADEDISSGTLVAEYQGEVITAPEFRRRKDLYRDEYNFYFMTLSTDPELFIDASRKSCIARFINHSCDPNCRTDKWTSRGRTVVGIFAIRDISRGTELSFDYRTDPVRGDRAVRCECGTDKCRGWLTGGPEGEIEDKANSLQGTAKAKGKAAVPAGGASAAGTASSSAPGPMKNPPSPRSQKIKDLAKMKRDAMKELDLEEIGVGRMSSERREAEDRRFVATQGGNQFAEGSDTDMRDVETDEELDNVRLSLSNTDCETAANVQSSVVLGSVVRTDIDAGRHAERTTDSLGSGALVDIGRDDDFVIPRLASGLAETNAVPVVAPLSGEVDALDELSPSDRRESFNPDLGSTPTFGFRDIGTGGTPRKVTAFGRMRENPFLHGEHSPAGLPALGRSTARERQPDDDGRSMNVEPNIRWRERRIRALGAPLMYGDDMDPYRKRPRREPTPEEQEMELHPDTRDQAAFDLATYERRLTNQPRGSRPMYGASPGAGRPFDSRPAASPRRPENRRFTPAAGTGVPGFGVRTFVEDEQTRAPPDIEYDSDGFAIPPASYGRQRLPPREAQIEREAQMERNRVNKLRAGWHQRLGGNRRDHRDVRGDTDRNRRADRYADGRSDRERDQYMDRERDQPRNRDSRHDIERDKFQDRGQEWNRDVRRGARYKERSIGDSGEYQDLGDANSPEASPRKLNRSGSPNHVKSNLGGTHRYSAVDRRPSFAHEGNDRKRGDLRERIVGRKESAGGPSEGAPSFGAPQSPRPRSMTYSERHASSEPGAATPSAQHGRNELRRDTDDVHDASPRSGRDDRQQPREDRAGSSAPRSDVNSSRGPQIDPSTSRALSAQHEGREESLKARVPAPPQKASGQVIVDDIRSILSARGSGQHKELPGAAREGPYVPPVKGARSNATSSYFSRSMTPGELDSSLQESASMDNPVRRNSFSGKKGRKDRRR